MSDPLGAEQLTYAGARAPDRTWDLDASGVRIAVSEWGAGDAPVLLLAHGGFDFARTFDVFAPLLAAAGHRVVAWDQRGHGDSEHAALYSFDADVRDAAALLDAAAPDGSPVDFVGHSKGGALLLRLAEIWPHRVRRIVNVDGLPSGDLLPDVADHERTRLLAAELTGWLDHRRRSNDRARRPDTVDGLARRRAVMNPRLPLDWLRYLVTVGGRHDPDGWRWKLDPVMRFGGFGPWRPEWALLGLPAIPVPLLALLASEPEPMGWGTTPERVAPYAPTGSRVEVVDGAGHFLHIEQPEIVAGRVVEFLA